MVRMRASSSRFVDTLGQYCTVILHFASTHRGMDGAGNSVHALHVVYVLHGLLDRLESVGGSSLPS